MKPHMAVDPKEPDSDDIQPHEIHGGMRTLMDAEEVKSNPKLMAKIAEHHGKVAKVLKKHRPARSTKELRELANDNSMEEKRESAKAEAAEGE